jgi:LacI family transcriptional regulator
VTSRVRLSDVARRAGVSPTTASFVLAGREDMRISEAAQQRVRAAAAELGYRPNQTARSLRTRVSRTIGFVSDTIATEPFAGETVRGATNAAVERGYLLLIAEAVGDAELERRLIDEMLDRQVDGLIYASMFTREVTVPDAVPVHRLVLLNALAPGVEVPAVVPDELAAGRAAAEVLLEAGHRDGIHLVGKAPEGLFAARERLAGIEAALGAADTALASIVECLWAPEPAHEAVAQFLAAGGAPSALICVNDRAAFGALHALHDAGLRVPRDVSIVSFDDSDLARWSRPAFTSVALPHEAMGRTAVELLLEPPEQPVVRRLPMPLRRRESVGPPARS